MRFSLPKKTFYSLWKLYVLIDKRKPITRMGCLEIAMRKKTTNIFQPSTTLLNRKIKSEPKAIELCLDEAKIKRILSAGALLTKGVLEKQ